VLGVVCCGALGAAVLLLSNITRCLSSRLLPLALRHMRLCVWVSQEDLHRVGGTPAVLKYLMEKGMIDGRCMTVTGKTMAENLAGCPPLSDGQDVLMPVETPIKKTGHLQVSEQTLMDGGYTVSLMAP
jgi:hypothetical protein